MDKLKDEIEEAFGISPNAIARRQAKEDKKPPREIIMKTVKPFDILLPDVAQPEKFAVVSCDQFTSQREYWDKLSAEIATRPARSSSSSPKSTLRTATRNRG